MTITLIQNEDLEGITYTSWNFHLEILFRTHGTNNSDFHIKLLHSRLYRIFAMTTFSFKFNAIFSLNAVLLKTFKSISVVGCHSYKTPCKSQKSQNSCMNPDEKLKTKSYIKFTVFFVAQKQKSWYHLKMTTVKWIESPTRLVIKGQVV